MVRYSCELNFRGLIMKKILSLLLGIILVGSLVGCGNKNDTANGNVENNKKEETRSKEVVGINYGESADSGNWNIKINNLEETQEIKGHEEKDNVKTEEKFIAILMDLKNISNDPQSYSLTEFKLYDTTTNKVYSIQDNGVRTSITYVSEERSYKKNNKYITLNDDVNPDETKIGCVVFDVDSDLNLDNLLLVNKSIDSTSNEVYFKLK